MRASLNTKQAVKAQSAVQQAPDIHLTVQNLKTSYNQFKLTNVSFQLQAGDMLGLVGRSGVGKSTLINTLVGLKKKDAGRITVRSGGKQVKLNRVIGYSPQENSLYPFLTLKENLETFAKLYGVKRGMFRKRMNFLLRRLDLYHCRNKKIIELSGGMQKRADLAVTLIHSPKIIILDEPFNGLDVSLQRFIWQLLKELAEQGRIIIISSHQLGEIQKHCNQFGLIENGGLYNTQQVMEALAHSNGMSLERFLEGVFTDKLNGGKKR
jgi:ABC-2 type transport system ATP-binding protein